VRSWLWKWILPIVPRDARGAPFASSACDSSPQTFVYNDDESWASRLTRQVRRCSGRSSRGRILSVLWWVILPSLACDIPRPLGLQIYWRTGSEGLLVLSLSMVSQVLPSRRSCHCFDLAFARIRPHTRRIPRDNTIRASLPVAVGHDWPLVSAH
jgi:hypothetical protein